MFPHGSLFQRAMAMVNKENSHLLNKIFKCFKVCVPVKYRWSQTLLFPNPMQKMQVVLIPRPKGNILGSMVRGLVCQLSSSHILLRVRYYMQLNTLNGPKPDRVNSQFLNWLWMCQFMCQMCCIQNKAGNGFIPLVVTPPRQRMQCAWTKIKPFATHERLKLWTILPRNVAIKHILCH